jgi:TusA-related sulfurtransferase
VAKFNPVRLSCLRRLLYNDARRLQGENRMTDPELVLVDATGLECPMPLLKAKRALNDMRTGQRLQVVATDQGSVRDFQVFAEQSGHTLLSSRENAGVYTYLLQKC